MYASATSIQPPAFPAHTFGQISLRPSTPADEDFLLTVYIASHDDEMAQVGWAATTKAIYLRYQFIAQQQHYQSNYANTTRCIVQLAEQPIGAMWIARWSAEIRLLEMALLRPHRNRGIGSHLLGNLIAEARHSGKPIVLHTWEGNPAASRFYARHGFRHVSSDGMFARMEWLP